MNTHNRVAVLALAVLTVFLCGCAKSAAITGETSSETSHFNLVAGVSVYMEDSSLRLDAYSPLDELDDGQIFLMEIGYEIDDTNYEDSLDGQDCPWFHFRNSLAEGGVIYCDGVFYIDYALVLDDGSLDMARSFRCGSDRLVETLANITATNNEPS